jgi:predicted Zn-dependent protease
MNGIGLQHPTVGAALIFGLKDFPMEARIRTGLDINIAFGPSGSFNESPSVLEIINREARVKKLLGCCLCVWVVTAAGVQGQGQADSAGNALNALSEMNRAFEASDAGELTQEDEYYLGRAVAAQILKTYPLYERSAAITAYVNRICQALVINSPQPGLFNGYHVGVLNSQEINAFATPGGHIFLTLGLLACADSEDALAAVIAHELAHIQLRHAAAAIADQRLVNELSQTADRAAAASRNASPRDRALVFNRNISVMVNVLFRNGFDQEQEFDADAKATALLRDTGYDPSAMLTMLRVLEQTQPLKPGGLNATHPSPSARIASLQKISLTGGGNKARNARTARFAAFQGLLRPSP